MNRKPRFPTRLLATAVSFLALTSAVFTQEVSQEVKDSVVRTMTRLITKSAFVPSADFNKLEEFLEQQKPAIDEASTPDQFRNAVNSALREFGFSHILLSTPEMAQARRDSSAVGIGITIQLDDDGILVIRVVPDGPADEAGLEPGDVIIESDGKKPQSPTDMLGPIDTQLTIKVKKADGKIVTHTLTRKKFSTIRPETLTWVTPETAQLTIHTFDLAYNRERVEELMREAARSKNLILDLRNNGGGAVLNLTHLMGMLLPEGQPIGTFISRSLVEQYVEEKGGSPEDLAGMAAWTKSKLRAARGKVAPYKGKVAVLVNGGSGSASEIAAAALREISGAKVIGTRSAGAVLVSVMAPLPHNYQLQYPVTDYVTLNGLRLEGNGVVPDVEATDPRVLRPGVKDEPVEKALGLLTQVRSDSGEDKRDGKLGLYGLLARLAAA
jgi:carboxyl-terminal processing protease